MRLYFEIQRASDDKCVKRKSLESCTELKQIMGRRFNFCAFLLRITGRILNKTSNPFIWHKLSQTGKKVTCCHGNLILQLVLLCRNSRLVLHPLSHSGFEPVATLHSSRAFQKLAFHA